MSNEFQLTIIGAYLLIFMTDVMQVNPIAAGSVFLVGEICDAFTDIFITNLADKTNTRWGKYRPWMLSAIPLAVFFVLNFFYPGFLKNDTLKIIWIYAMYLLAVPIFQTCFICPFITMNNVMSRDSANRLDFATCRTIGENLADILVNTLVMTIILHVGTSFTDIAGWRTMALLFAALMIVTAVIGFSGTKERAAITNQNEQGEQLSLASKLKLYHHNPAAQKMLVITTAFYFFFSFANIMFSYFCIHVLGHEEWVAGLSTAGIVAQALIVFCLPWLGRRCSHRTLVGAGCGLLLAAFAVCMFMNSYESVLLYQILKGAGIGFTGSLIWSMWPEVSDYTERKTGIAAPGIIMAVGTFFMKMGFAFSSFSCSWVLELSGYDAGLSAQPQQVLTTIRMAFAAVPAVCVGVTMVANYLLKELEN